MELVAIQSYAELAEQLKQTKKAYLLLHKAGSDSSACAYNNLGDVAKAVTEAKLMTANVAEVRDIHPEFGITSVPTLLEFEDGELRNVIKGCQDASYLKAYFENAVFAAQAEAEGKPRHSVTVYTTPTCSWCTTLKSYLKKNKIQYREIDVSKDQKAAEEMVKRSGQQGVPQSLIDGQTVVGFDQKKIDQLLGIQ